ncbi:flavodoxin [Tetragenococcus halophilus subsp. flandriensis]|uniref:flavodoxin family protein n=1 Tax=Tetragenococcus halophilus TaxID=51669 RepID=UPI0023E9BB83|nr:flavodoxin [Tetragenococcus halophilus]GMA08379.1 flavodoxin [Tetragenococcus halophilus subsp. flandriensis]
MKKFFAIVFSSMLLLTGCAGSQEENEINQENNNQSNQSSAELEESSSEDIVATDQYGRGAQSDGQDTNSTEEVVRELSEDSDAIIIYFSRSGNTENLVKMMQDQTNADALELTLDEPYPADYDETVERADEERESENFPEINTEMPDFSQYDHIYLGYQTWSMTLSNPMISFLEVNGEALDGKTIYPFSTNAGYGEGDSIERIQEMLPNSTVEESFSVEDEDATSSQDELEDWLAGQ